MLNPLQQTDSVILKDTDLAGPLMFCLLFGAILLLVSLASHTPNRNRGLVNSPGVVQNGMM